MGTEVQGYRGTGIEIVVVIKVILDLNSSCIRIYLTKLLGGNF